LIHCESRDSIIVKLLVCTICIHWNLCISKCYGFFNTKFHFTLYFVCN